LPIGEQGNSQPSRMLIILVFGRFIDYPEREYSNLLGETPRIQFLDDDIVSAIGNNGTSVRSGFQVRILVPEHLTNRTEMCDFDL